MPCRPSLRLYPAPTLGIGAGARVGVPPLTDPVEPSRMLRFDAWSVEDFHQALPGDVDLANPGPVLAAEFAPGAYAHVDAFHKRQDTTASYGEILGCKRTDWVSSASSSPAVGRAGGRSRRPNRDRVDVVDASTILEHATAHGDLEQGSVAADCVQTGGSPCRYAVIVG